MTAPLQHHPDFDPNHAQTAEADFRIRQQHEQQQQAGAMLAELSGRALQVAADASQFRIPGAELSGSALQGNESTPETMTAVTIGDRIRARRHAFLAQVGEGQ